MALVEVVAAAAEDRDEVLDRAAAAEHGSQHPIAAAIVRARGATGRASEFRSLDGLGVRALVDGEVVHVGRPSLLAEAGQPLPDELRSALADAEAGCRTVVAVGW